MKRMLSMLLALCLTAVLPAGALAVDVTASGGGGTATVVLDAAAATFKVTVPSALPVYIAADGTVTCAASGAAKIVNHSNGPVEVTEVRVEDVNGWTKQAYGYDFSATPLNSREYTLQLNGADAVDGSVPSELFGDGGVIAGGGSADVSYAVDAAAQSTALSEVTIANVVVTVAWHSA